MKNITRTKSQEIIMQCLSSYLICSKEGVLFNVEENLSELCNSDYEDVPLYIKEVVIKSLKCEKEAIDYISNFLNKWKFERLNVCVQAILLMSYTEYKFFDDIDKRIIINNAVELTKNYDDIDKHKFVNAVLDKALNESIK